MYAGIPLMPTPAGPCISSYPLHLQGMMNPFAYGFGPYNPWFPGMGMGMGMGMMGMYNLGLGCGNPYGYMVGQYW